MSERKPYTGRKKPYRAQPVITFANDEPIGRKSTLTPYAQKKLDVCIGKVQKELRDSVRLNPRVLERRITPFTT